MRRCNRSAFAALIPALTAIVFTAILFTATVPSASPAVAAETRAVPTVSLRAAPWYPQPGQTATLTARITGKHGTPTGWVRFRFNGAIIAGCAHLVLHRGLATCTAPRSYRSRRSFVVGYSGSTVYRPSYKTLVTWS